MGDVSDASSWKREMLWFSQFDVTQHHVEGPKWIDADVSHNIRSIVLSILCLATKTVGPGRFRHFVDLDLLFPSLILEFISSSLAKDTIFLLSTKAVSVPGTS